MKPDEPNATPVSVETPPIEHPEIRPGAYAWTVRTPDGDEHITSDAKDPAAFFAAHIKGREAIVTPDAVIVLGHGTVAIRPGWVTDDDNDDEEDEARGNRPPLNGERGW